MWQNMNSNTKEKILYIMKIFFGVILIILGYFLKEMEKKRHFDRRNSAGVEGFESYFDLKYQKIIDFFIRKSGIILIVIGILILL